MLAKFKNNLLQLIPKKAQIIAACSGGVDSVVLTHLLHKCNVNLAIAHCNFSLRGNESEEDYLFVQQLAKKYQVPFFYKKFKTQNFASKNGMSIQMAARSLRYQWFNELLKEHQFHFVATAHHTDDDLETFLINLSRGSGINGLVGIPEKNKQIIRPLLSFSRDQIEAFAKKNELYWREDSSNQSDYYLRNNLRLNVIPTYKQTTPHLLENFKKSVHYLKQSQGLVEDYLQLVTKLVVSTTNQELKINITKINALPNTEALLYQLLNNYGFSAWNDIFQLVKAQSGKVVYSATHQLLKDRDSLILTKLETTSPKDLYFLKKSDKQITHPIFLRFIPTKKMGYINNTTIYVNQEKIKYPLVLRKWNEGDFFYPFGMQGKKKLSKFFKDEKLSLIAKNNIWLLCSEDKIIWIIGYRIDDRFKITPTTKKIIKIECKL